MTGRQQKKCLELMRRLISEIQGAPYSKDCIDPELYEIWFEHAQKTAVECFQFVNENDPKEQRKVAKSIDKILK